MSSLYVLIPLGLLFCAIAAGFLIYASRHRQFDDLDRAARSVLDDDPPPSPDPVRRSRP